MRKTWVLALVLLLALPLSGCRKNETGSPQESGTSASGAQTSGLSAKGYTLESAVSFRLVGKSGRQKGEGDEKDYVTVRMEATNHTGEEIKLLLATVSLHNQAGEKLHSDVLVWEKLSDGSSQKAKMIEINQKSEAYRKLADTPFEGMYMVVQVKGISFEDGTVLEEKSSAP